MRYVLFGMLGGLIVSSVIDTQHKKVDLQCYTKDSLTKYIDDNKFQTFFQSITIDGKKHETMFTPLNNQEMIVVEYTDKNKYCIISDTNKTKINENSIDLLHDKLEKIRGERS